MKGILLKQRGKDGEISISENWILPAKGNYPERAMTTFAFYDFDEGTIERMTLNADEIKSLKLYDEGGEEIEKIKLEELFSNLSEGTLKVIEVETVAKKKGKMTLETVVGLRLVSTASIDF